MVTLQHHRLAARRLLPYQNLWYIRGLLNALEDETAEELELKGR